MVSSGNGKLLKEKTHRDGSNFSSSLTLLVRRAPLSSKAWHRGASRRTGIAVLYNPALLRDTCMAEAEPCLS